MELLAEDCAAAAELIHLLRVEARAAEVDEVEVDAVDPGAAQVRGAEVGLPDLVNALAR